MERFERVADGIHVLRVPFGPVWTGVTLVTGEENCVIDSSATAEDVDRYVIPALAELGIGPGDVRWLLNTHCHGDHIGGHRRFCEIMQPSVAAFEGSAAKVEDPVPFAVRIRTRFPEHSPAPQSFLKGVRVDRALSDGEIIAGRLQVVHTPGHDDDCVCWYDIPTKTLITGDSLQANGTICQGVGFYQDLAGYRGALDRLRGMEIETILCGHDYDGIGWLIRGREAVADALKKCAEYTEKYQEFIARCRRGGEKEPAAIAEKLIDGLGCGRPERLFMALYTVTQHLAEGEEG